MDNPLVLLETTAGDILLEIFPDEAPLSAANFLAYVDEGFYRDTIFHRVIKGFMIQGGGLTLRLEEKPTRAPVPNEAANGLKNLRGSLSMARAADPHSAAAQFFINTVDNPELDFRSPDPEGFGYCVFGRVADGMEVVDKIEKSKVKATGVHEALPADSVLIVNAGRF
ncbi:MAG: peptidylprolyl isomerase [Desulfovibrio sp.]|jgi:peptidyl-prolyl cis-trans isomerase B (cyclophilin B)|nr:peptidylprolyl isomerase [Desulfovibrio sp.]